eukprot:CAMPEP_0178408614 /NCGR_PEP_ID=MMETSP0689_2-20121128/20033_1 /TAXON_ID=160604 /ORGANISM="Amphidinium massartii, Strain CS-259" /LENGTH=322 /DNA_ID=CAMNT_0020029721 /DNA_START=26 /DNA_END=991 /DNA_ORIENTATION=-
MVSSLILCLCTALVTASAESLVRQQARASSSDAMRSVTLSNARLTSVAVASDGHVVAAAAPRDADEAELLETQVEVEAKAAESCVPPGMSVASLQAGFSMVVLGENDIVSKDLLHGGCWEDIRTAADFAAKVGGSLPANGTFLDIGANLGYYSMLFAHAGYNVIAVEPMTRNRAAIEGTFCMNPELRSRVTVVPTALVDPTQVDNTKCIIRSTNAAINIGNGALKCGSLAEIEDCAPHDPNCEAVPVKTLNTVLSDMKPGRIDVVKMDVESYECHVLAGGDHLFSHYSPKLMKIETEWGNTSSCVSELAQKQGYRTHPLAGT